MLKSSRRLRWRMTYSYILVTLPSMVLIQGVFLALIGAAFYAFMNSQLMAEEQARMLAPIAGQASPYLAAETTDVAGLSEWLESATCSGGPGPTMFPPNSYPPVLLAAVVDRSGRVLAEQTGALPAGAAIADALDPHGSAILRAALDGQTAPGRLAIRQPDNSVVAAAPIVGADDRVLGAWLVRVGASTLMTRNEAMVVFGVFLIPLAILASCFAIVFGLIYGHRTSRSLVERLRGLAAAAHTWSAGDFRAAADDRSEDELGLLARRLNHMAAQLQTLVTTRQDLATLQERNRLARDLHDSVKQQLFAISMQLASARTLLVGQPPVDALLLQAETLTHSAQQELTATILALRPAALGSGELVDSLRAYVDSWRRQHAIDAEVSCEGRCALPAQQEQMLFRVAQEALSNVARHSAATRVAVVIGSDPQAVSMTIVDNGRGFDPAAVASHGIGLQSMRERLEAYAGSLTITSSPGQGTRLVARVPSGEEVTP